MAIHQIKFIVLYYNSFFSTNTPPVFHVKTTRKRSFPHCFNVKYTWCAMGIIKLNCFIPQLCNLIFPYMDNKISNFAWMKNYTYSLDMCNWATNLTKSTLRKWGNDPLNACTFFNMVNVRNIFPESELHALHVHFSASLSSSSQHSHSLSKHHVTKCLISVQFVWTQNQQIMFQIDI